MFSISGESKRIRITLLTFIAVFFLLNLFAALRYGTQNYLGDFQTWNNDDVKYVRSAWELVAHGNFIYHRVTEPTVFIMPGLTVTLAFFMKIFGPFGGITAFRVFQAVLQAGSLYLVFLIGRKIFNSKAALIACGISLLWISEYYATTMILTEVLFKFFFLLLVYLSYLAIEAKKTAFYVAGGAVWALACLVRPTVAAFPAVILIMWIIRKYTIQEMIKYTLVTVLVFAALMSPWWIRNYKVFDRFIPLTLSTGNPFLQGTYIDYDPTQDFSVYQLGDNYIETNQNEMNAGIERLKTHFREDPMGYIRWYTIGKSWYLWYKPFYWKIMMGVSYELADLYHRFIVAAFALGTVLALAGKKKNTVFLLLTIGFTNLMYLPYYTMPRYFYPVMPLIGIIAGFLFSELFRRKSKAVKK